VEALLKEAFLVEENYRQIEKQREEIHKRVVSALQALKRSNLRTLHGRDLVNFSLCNNSKKLNVHIQPLDGVIA
jgi:hypothetical protein